MTTRTYDVFNPDGSRRSVTVDVPQSEVNYEALRAKANNAFAANATFLALAAPTNAQAINQIQLLTKEFNALAKLYLNQLDDTNGT